MSGMSSGTAAIGLAVVACLLACETSQSGGGAGPPKVETNVAPSESAPDQQASRGVLRRQPDA